MKFLKRLLLFIILIIILVSSIILFLSYNYYSKSLEEKSLSDRVLYIQNDNDFIKYEDLTQNYINAVIATEDHRFYDHGAIDFIAIMRAILVNIKNGEFQEGGSTITQQVAKNICLTQEKSVIRKVAELFAAYDLENNYSKDEIFELYVNTAYFGDGYYGIRQASQGYYNKEPKDLNLSEASMLAGIPNAPSIYAPTKNIDLATQRQKQVLNKMIKYGYITEQNLDNLNLD